MDPVTMLAVASVAAGAFGKKKGSASQSQSGFGAMPPEVQKVFLETYLPSILEQFNKGYQPSPMQRVNAPSSPFDSQGLYDLQKYSDNVGGLFAPKQNLMQQGQHTANQQAQDMYGMSLGDYIGSQRGDVQDQVDRGITTPDSWWRNFGSKGK